MFAYLNEVDKPGVSGVTCGKKEKAIASRIRNDTNIEEPLIPAIFHCILKVFVITQFIMHLSYICSNLR